MLTPTEFEQFKTIHFEYFQNPINRNRQVPQKYYDLVKKHNQLKKTLSDSGNISPDWLSGESGCDSRCDSTPPITPRRTEVPVLEKSTTPRNTRSSTIGPLTPRTISLLSTNCMSQPISRKNIK